jgi:hypothetical protein
MQGRMQVTQANLRGFIARIAVECECLTGPELAPLCGLVGSDWHRELFVPFANGRGVSTCGLVAEGIWHRAGIAIPRTWRPYRPEREVQKAIARAHQFAIANRAVRRFDGANAPSMGDYVVIGEGLRTHAMTCITCEHGVLESIDGGQVGRGGLQTVKLRERDWIVRGANAFAGDRRVQFWIDVSSLPLSP